MGLPVGLAYDPAGNVVLDPDYRLCNKPSGTVFSTVRPHRLGRARYVQQFNAGGPAVPGAGAHQGARKGELAWMPLQHWRCAASPCTIPATRARSLRPPPRIDPCRRFRARSAESVARPVGNPQPPGPAGHMCRARIERAG